VLIKKIEEDSRAEARSLKAFPKSEIQLNIISQNCLIPRDLCDTEVTFSVNVIKFPNAMIHYHGAPSAARYDRSNAKRHIFAINSYPGKSRLYCLLVFTLQSGI
jgi:hypothetical protein